MKADAPEFGLVKYRSLIFSASLSAAISTLSSLLGMIVVGNMIGPDALAAINLISPLAIVSTFGASLVAVGTSIRYSYCMGGRDADRAHRVFSIGVMAALIMGIGMAAAAMLSFGPLVAFLAPGEKLVAMSADYGRWYLPSLVLDAIVTLIVTAVMNDGDSRLSTASYAVRIAVEIGGAVLVIPHFGLKGYAAVIGFAKLCALAVASLHFLRKTNSYRFVPAFSWSEMRRIVTLSIGDASSFVCNAILFVFLNKFVIARYGSDMLPVLACVIQAIGFLDIFSGVGNALAPVITVYFGEGDTRSIRRLMADGQRLSVVQGLVMTALVFLLAEPLVRMVGISDPAMVAGGAKAVRIVSFGFVFYSFAYLFNSYYIFINRCGLSAAVTVLEGLALPVSLALSFGGLGEAWLWVSLALAPAAAILVMSAIIMLWHGRRLFPLLLTDCSREANYYTFSLYLNPEKIVDASRRVGLLMSGAGVSRSLCMRAELMTEEVLMAVKDHNAGKRVLAEVSLDLNDVPRLTLRDDGEIFDITDTDRDVSSLRTYLVASVMEKQDDRLHLVTTGFNRNVFEFAPATT